jgi:hypothetical protein
LSDGPEAFCCAEREWTNARIFFEVEKLARKRKLDLETVCTSLCREAAAKHGLLKEAQFGAWSAGKKLTKEERISVVRLASLVGYLRNRQVSMTCD